MGRVQDKVVLVTGAARGQGRSHAVKLAEEGADIILFDICHDIETNEYPLATSRDLEEAGLEVEKTGRKAYTAEVDVRDRAAVNRELANAVAEFGKLDVVVANAGICPLGASLPIQAFGDAFDVDFIGVVNTVHAALPYLKSGASIITTGSVAGLIASKMPPGAAGPQGPGGGRLQLRQAAGGLLHPAARRAVGAAVDPRQRYSPHQCEYLDAQQRADVPPVPAGPGQPDP